MLMNSVEKAMMNNPIRAALQRHFEMPTLLAMGGRVEGGCVLEVGCGRGVGTELILARSGAERVDAFDLDPEMVALARRRLHRHGDRVRINVGDVEHIEAEDSVYDAVFDFGIIHHVPDWRNALSEIHRVLKPGGRFYAEEVLERFILDPLWRRLLVHPLEDRFNYDCFRQALAETGFQVVESRQLWGQFAWFVADKPSPGSATPAADASAAVRAAREAA